MLNLLDSRLIETFIRKMASNVSYIEEGTPLVAVFESGNEVVKPSTGVANENFIGFALSEAIRPDYINVAESFVIPAASPYTITLSRNIDLTKTFSFIVKLDNGVRDIITVNADPATVDAVKIVGNQVTFHQSFATKTVEALYVSPLLSVESNMLYPQPSQTMLNEIEDTGVISKGPIHITNFDKTVDWATFNAVSNPVKLGNGIVTLGGAGTTIPCHVAGLPEANEGFLVLRVNA